MTETTTQAPDTQATESTRGALSGALSQMPVDRLKDEAQNFGKALGHKGASMASSGIQSLTNRLVRYAASKAVSKVGESLTEGASPVKEGVKSGVKNLAGNLAEGDSPVAEGAKAIAEGDSPVKAGFKALGAKVKDTFKKAFGGGGGKLKVTNIVEAIDVPVSREVAYRQWTQFEDFPSFMKKVESVNQEEDQTNTWKAQIFWSHRGWKATIVDQVPNEHIVWKSDGDKGHVDGAVTFHELAPNLTRILVTLEYYPKGLFEHTGNLWRAQGRRARLEMKHFRRHVSMHTLLNPDEVQGWLGEIHDKQVTDTGERASQDGGPPDEGSEPSAESSERSSEEPSDQSSEEESSDRSSSDRSSDREPSEGRPPAKKAAAKAPPGKKAGPPAKKAASPTKNAPAKKSGGMGREPAGKGSESRPGS